MDYLLQFAEDFEIEDAEKVLHEVCSAVSEFPSLARENGLPDLWTDKISFALDSIFPERKTFS